MRIRYLRYFLAVAEERSFTRAAVRVHIEASPLSRAIRELESELRVHLIQRVNGRIRLTRAGEVFRDEARRMLGFLDDARLRARSAEQGYRRCLRIGLADRLAQPRLIRLLARCREEEPLTEVRILEMSVEEMVGALNDERIDAGFTVHPEPGGELHREIVWQDRFAVVIPRNHPLLGLPKIPLDEAARYPLLLFHPEACPGGHDILRRGLFDPIRVSPRIAEYVSGHEPMLMLAAAGMGIGIGLESQIALYSHPGVVIRPVADEVPLAATFLVMSGKPPSDELNLFIARVRRIGRQAMVH